MATKTISLRKSGYSLSESPYNRWSALYDAVKEHGVEKVEARLDELLGYWNDSVHGGQFANLMKDIEFIQQKCKGKGNGSEPKAFFRERAAIKGMLRAPQTLSPGLLEALGYNDPALPKNVRTQILHHALLLSTLNPDRRPMFRHALWTFKRNFGSDKAAYSEDIDVLMDLYTGMRTEAQGENEIQGAHEHENTEDNADAWCASDIRLRDYGYSFSLLPNERLSALVRAVTDTSPEVVLSRLYVLAKYHTEASDDIDALETHFGL